MSRLLNEPVSSWQLTDAQLAARDIENMPWSEAVKAIARNKNIGLNTLTSTTLSRAFEAEWKMHRNAYKAAEWIQIMTDLAELQAKQDALTAKLKGKTTPKVEQ